MERISKNDARAFGRKVRSNMDAGRRADASRAIAGRCQEVLPWRDGQNIHVFMSISTKFEVDTRPLIDWVFTAFPSACVYAPRMDASGMLQAQIYSDTVFALDRFGIPEPSSRNVRSVMKFDLIFVPLLAFDGVGHRVGYGAGHYDRFLAQHAQALRVGLAYEDSYLSSLINASDHDIRLDLVVTDKCTRQF